MPVFTPDQDTRHSIPVTEQKEAPISQEGEEELFRVYFDDGRESSPRLRRSKRGIKEPRRFIFE